MFQYFKKISVICSCCLFFVPIVGGYCQVNNDNTITIAEYLIQKVNKGTDNNFTTSLLLLSHLSLADTDIMKLDSIYKKEKDPIKKLFIVFTLYQRTQEKNYENDFVELYPVGKQQRHIWKISRYETEYINVSSPLQQRLADFAITNKIALEKLLSGYEFADGADGDSLSDQIIHIYKENPDYVLKELQKKNIDLSELGIK